MYLNIKDNCLCIDWVICVINGLGFEFLLIDEVVFDCKFFDKFLFFVLLRRIILIEDG